MDKMKIYFEMSSKPPKNPGYYWAREKGSAIPRIVTVLSNSEKMWVQGYKWIPDLTKPLVNGHIQGYVAVLDSIPLEMFEEWSDPIPIPEKYKGLFLKFRDE